MTTTLRDCHACGFTKAETGKACPLCDTPEGQAKSPSLSAAETSALPPGMIVDPDRLIARHFREGTLFADRFLIGEVLGEGGMGTVYRVTRKADGEALAMKVLLSSILDSPNAITRFQREAQLVSKIDHPAVPKVVDWGCWEGQSFYVAELIDGEDLDVILERDGRQSAEQASVWAADVCDALHAAHQAGIVHRDVKPHNIMIDSQGRTHLLDFGVARGVSGELKTLTVTGMLVGTPQYMSPEQLESTGVDPRSDVYALGVVLYQAVTGELPFNAATPFAVALKHKNEDPPPPRSLADDLPMWMERIILTCLQKNPVNRYDSAAALAAILRVPHSKEKPRKRSWPGGDFSIEDPGGLTDWPLQILSKKRMEEWNLGSALRFQDAFYRFVDELEPGQDGRWTYCLEAWPENEILRRIIDWREHVDEAKNRPKGIAGMLKGLIKR